MANNLHVIPSDRAFATLFAMAKLKSVWAGQAETMVRDLIAILYNKGYAWVAYEGYPSWQEQARLAANLGVSAGPAPTRQLHALSMADTFATHFFMAQRVSAQAGIAKDIIGSIVQDMYGKGYRFMAQHGTPSWQEQEALGKQRQAQANPPSAQPAAASAPAAQAPVQAPAPEQPKTDQAPTLAPADISEEEQQGDDFVTPSQLG